MSAATASLPIPSDNAETRAWVANAVLNRAIVFGLLLVLGFSAISHALGAVANIYTDHRLMPLFMMRDGIRVYADPGQGPMLSTLYPPLSVLLYAPALLFHSPRTAFFVAGLLVQVFSLGPLTLAVYLTRTDRRSHISALLAITAFVLFCNSSDILNNLYLVHADAPAIFLITSGLCCLLLHHRRRTLALLCAASVLIGLSVWAKQTVAPALLVIPLLLLLRREWSLLCVSIASSIATQVVIMLLVIRRTDFHQLLTWLIVIPSKHPWKANPSSTLDDTNRLLLMINFAALVILITVGVRMWQRKHSLRKALGEPWVVFSVTGVLLWPTTVLGFVKIGGANNTLMYATYFLFASVLLLAVQSWANREATGVRIAVIVSVCLLSVPLLIDAAKDCASPGRLLHSSSVDAYEFSVQHPGFVYFPFHPLSVYMAEHRLYHFEFGVSDRAMAGIPIRPDHFQAYIPPHLQYVAFRERRPDAVLALMPEYNRPVSLPELPGWTVLARQ